MEACLTLSSPHLTIIAPLPQDLIAKEKESFRLFNEPRAKKMCFDELQQLYKPLNEAIMDGKYMKPGGYQDYLDSRREFRKAYLGSGHGRGLLVSRYIYNSYDINYFIFGYVNNHFFRQI